MLTFEQVVNLNTIKESHRKTNRGKFKFTKQSIRFDIEREANLLKILQHILNNTYTFDKYQCMVITDNKRREVHAPSFKDKIYHHMLNTPLLKFVTTRFVKQSFSCIKKRGNLNAVKHLQNCIRIANRLYGNHARLIKIDISKFFYTINRDILKERLTHVIKDLKVLNLAYNLIDSFKEEDIGLPLGNLTSQTFANIYLDYIDKYITRTLKIKYYMRYADDIFIIVPNLETAKEVRLKVIDKLIKKLKLIVNPNKCYITTLDRVHALGYHIFLDRLRLDSRNKKKFKHYLRKQQIKSLNGWYAQASYAKCHSLIFSNLINTNMIFNGKVFRFK